MKRLIIIASILSGGISGCKNDPQSDAIELPSELTAERARDAMIELIRSPDAREFAEFRLDAYINSEVRIDASGNASWAWFFFDLKAKTYSYHQERGERGTKDHYAFGGKGKFEFRNGKWVAIIQEWHIT